MNNSMIRIATPEDAKAILAIYQPYVLNTAITFEYEVVTVEAFRKRMETVLAQFPWLVYEKEGKILGYAYCTRFRERAAYDWDGECTVYIDEKAHRQGIATALYDTLFEILNRQGYCNIYAVITYPNDGSVAIHKRFGFTEVGILHNSGYKLEKWWDVLIMEKQLRPLTEELSPTKPISIQEL